MTGTSTPAPVLILTRDDALARTLSAHIGGVPHLTTTETDTAERHAPDAAALIIGADMLPEVAGRPFTLRPGVFVVEAPDGPRAHIPGAATLPGVAVELAQPGAAEWLAGEVRNLAAGGDPGTAPNGCEECGAVPGEPCRVSNCQGSWY